MGRIGPEARRLVDIRLMLKRDFFCNKRTELLHHFFLKFYRKTGSYFTGILQFAVFIHAHQQSTERFITAFIIGKATYNNFLSFICFYLKPVFTALAG